MLNQIQTNEVKRTRNSEEAIQEAVEESLKLTFPTWPLQNAVAVNPFWYLRDQCFESALEEASIATRNSLMLPIDLYLDKLRTGEITASAITEALNSARQLWSGLPESV